MLSKHLVAFWGKPLHLFSSCELVAVESEENHGTRLKQTFQVFILTTSAGWLRDFTPFRQRHSSPLTTSYLVPYRVSITMQCINTLTA